jgi:glycosyltransferase involved in cell wall biosynthesis
MPVYNAERYLAASIKSISDQTHANFEFIIVDDGSTDQSLRILKRLAQDDNRIRVFTQSNTGIVGALNNGLSRATGTYLARMDADDIASPSRFEKQLKYLSEDPKCVALGTAVMFTDPEGRPLKHYRPSCEHLAIRDELAKGNGGALVHPTLMFRRDVLIQCGGYREKYNFIEDLDLFVRLLNFGQLTNLSEPLLLYRQHPHSVNHRVGDRSAQIAEIVAPLRTEMNLPPLETKAVANPNAANGKMANFRRKWAFDAVEGGNYATARVNAFRAVLAEPGNRLNWSCLRYAFRQHQARISAEAALA